MCIINMEYINMSLCMMYKYNFSGFVKGNELFFDVLAMDVLIYKALNCISKNIQ